MRRDCKEKFRLHVRFEGGVERNTTQKKKGRNGNHPKEEEAKHSTEEREKAAPPKGGEERQHHPNGEGKRLDHPKQKRGERRPHSRGGEEWQYHQAERVGKDHPHQPTALSPFVRCCFLSSFRLVLHASLLFGVVFVLGGTVQLPTPSGGSAMSPSFFHVLVNHMMISWMWTYLWRGNHHNPKGERGKGPPKRRRGGRWSGEDSTTHNGQEGKEGCAGEGGGGRSSHNGTRAFAPSSAKESACARMAFDVQVRGVRSERVVAACQKFALDEQSGGRPWKPLSSW